MRSLLCVAAVVLLLGSGLTGCLSGSKDAPAAPVNASKSSAPAVAVDTGNSTNATGDMGHMAHMHDYWKGKERLTVMDQDLDIAAQQALGYTFSDVLRDRTPGVGGTTVNLPDNATVFEGTGKMEFSVLWSDPTITGLTMRYRSAASTAWSEAKPITSGAAVGIDVAPDMCDMPHEQTSRWVFMLTPGEGQIVEGKIHVKIDIIRLHDITLWPGHAMLFNGGHTLTLFDGQGTSSHQSFATAIVDRVQSQGNDQPQGVVSQKVVPMETMWMSANVTVVDASAQIGSVRNISFLYKAADTNQFRRANVTHSDIAKGVFQFSWPVKMDQTDSPYAKVSQWRFDLLIQTSDPSGTGVLAQCPCSDAQVQYKAVIVAYDVAKPVLDAAPTAS